MNQNLKQTISEKFRNTELGFLRIKKNLGVPDYSDRETEDLLRQIILATPLENIESKGKNHYFHCFDYNAVLTVNSYTLTIITAKKVSKSDPVLRLKDNK